MKEITLISVDSVKELTSICDNMTPKFLRPAIIQAQEDRFLPIVGQRLYDKLKEVAGGGESSPAVKPYIELLNRARYFLAYSAVVKVIPQVAYKISNAGVVTTGDEKMQPVDRVALDNQLQFYQNEADSACYRLQNWILAHREDYPELDLCQCSEIRSHLKTYATCGLYLGGDRAVSSVERWDECCEKRR